jgi:BirA family biotin operon repressor/biotin-[acetyl-CoA-carboxylase] ligase
MPKLTLLAGVVVIKTIENICDIKASLKWPNDVLIDGKKVCGILSEIAKSSKKIEYVVVGIGVNVNNDINLSGTEYPAISLKSKLGHEIILESFIIKLLENFELYYKNFLKNPELIVNEWKKHSETLGKNVKIALVKETISGIAVDLSNTGALILELNDGSIREIIAGDCIHLMPSKKKESTKKF